MFLDNLYAYGPQRAPLVETMAPTTYGKKPVVRAQVAGELLRAHAEGRAGVMIVRASDFYGPGVRQSALGEGVFEAALAGRTIWAMGDLDLPHTFTYVPDLAVTLATMAEREEAFGQVWHAPSAPPVTLRQVTEALSGILGKVVTARAVPAWALRAAALFSPMAGELVEMRFQWDRPFMVSHDKLASRFPAQVTPLVDGLRATVAFWADGNRQGFRESPAPRVA